MALPMLVNGADCGPSNALRGLTKNFDSDRGLQQDFFGAGRAGSSRDVFRSAPASSPGLRQEVSQFFGGQGPVPASQLPSPSAFDLAALHATLPNTAAVPARSLLQPQVQTPVATWAADFLTQTPSASQVVASPVLQQEQSQVRPQPLRQMSYQQPMMPMFPMNQMHAMSPSVQRSMSSSHIDASSLEQAFHSHETLLSQAQETAHVQDQVPLSKPEYDDELARTAADIISAISHEENPKFKNSQFMNLMRQLRDHDVIIEGNDMVPQSEASGRASADVKGKGKAVDFAHEPTTIPTSHLVDRTEHDWAGQQHAIPADPNEAYFDQENTEYAAYWGEHHTGSRQRQATMEDSWWDRLQKDWDSFETTSAGVRPVDTSEYVFQVNNPYVLGERSSTQTTRHHFLHDTRPHPFFESVLQLEAAVHREPTNARAWFDLGVKQQENERETQALRALRRAVALDPDHLPAWLALATSSTNEGLRQDTLDAVREWIIRNERYARAVAAHGGPGETFESLIACLITMVRDAGEEVDADVQIALAVLLNNNEDHSKACDCFQAALAARPDDWVLYNRVGATLANNGSADEAIQYYSRALELNPAYIRARFNLGISCINMSRYPEAAQHILDALVLQDGDGVHGQDSRGVTTASLWDSMRMTCLHMQRMDLIDFCEKRDLDGIRAVLSG